MSSLYNRGVSKQALALATQQPVPTLSTNADVDLQLRVLALQVVPEVFEMGRRSLCELCANLRRAYCLIQTHAIPSARTWPSHHALLIEANALFAGLVFLCDVWIRKDQRWSKELVPMLTETLHRAIYFGGDVRAAMETETKKLFDICFREGLEMLDEGTQYVFKKWKAPARRWHVGSASLRTQRGRHRGRPRWP